jgi:gas vesicle protein
MGKSSLLKKLAVGAAVAGAAGYVVGVLTAPAEGKKTRKQLKKTADKGMDDIEQQLSQLHSELGDLVHEAKGNTGELSSHMQKKFGGAIDNARTAKDKLREVLSSVHDGKANDKDLKKSLEDARRSLEHLKQFLRK